MPVAPSLMRLYAEYMHVEYGGLDCDYVFVNLWGGQVGRPLTYASVNDTVLATRRRVGFHFTAHWFRHTYATLRPHEQAATFRGASKTFAQLGDVMEQQARPLDRASATFRDPAAVFRSTGEATLDSRHRHARP